MAGGRFCFLKVSLTKTIVGLEIFSVGTHTDSMGSTETFTGTNLDYMVEQFDAGDPWRPAVKLGHTSDEFNEMVATALGVPVETLEGENGGGVIALGEIVRLERKQNKLLADLQIPDQLADLFDRGFLREVSSEMILDETGEWVISGVAMLGAEAPAVSDLKGIAAAAVHKTEKNPKVLKPAHAFSRRVPTIVFTKGIGIPVYDDDTPGMKRLIDAIVSRIKRATGSEDTDVKTVKFTTDELKKLFAEDEDDDEEMDKESATDAIQKLQDESGKLKSLKEALIAMVRELQDEDEDDEDVEDELEEGAEPEVIAAAVKARLVSFKAKAAAVSGDMAAAIKAATEPLAAQIKTFQKADKVSKFETRVGKLLIPGKPEDHLKQLADLDEDVAEVILVGWEASSDIIKSMGITTPIGRANGEMDDEDDETRDVKFDASVAEHAREYGVSEAEATKAVRLLMYTERNLKPEAEVDA